MKQPIHPEYPFNDEDRRLPVLSERDHAHILIDDQDYDAQLLAIGDLLRHHAESERSLRDAILNADRDARQLNGLANEHAIDEFCELVHASIYQDAAHSMAAVGMLAPFIESIFHSAFLNMGKKFSNLFLHSSTVNPRLKEKDDKKWDCHYVFSKGKWQKNLVDGILELSDAVALTPCLPDNFRQMAEALFAYRNKMFHCGFEWPQGERTTFEKRIKIWPQYWFSSSRHGGYPWIFYMSEQFVSECTNATGHIVESIGAFARQLINRASQVNI